MKERSDDSYLVDKAQPFGVVQEMPVHGGTPTDKGFSSKPLGPSTVHSNHGYDHGPSFASKSIKPKALNPFAPIHK